MHIDDDQCINFLSILRVQVGSHQINKIVQVFCLLFWFLLHCVFVSSFHFIKNVFNSPCPPDLSTSNWNHTNIFNNPVYSLLRAILENRLFHHSMKSFLHLNINFSHPNLDRRILRFDNVFEIKFFTFIWLHALNLFAFAHNQLFAVIEKFQHMRLDSFRIRTSKNSKQIFIRKKIKSGEDEPFRVEIFG